MNVTKFAFTVKMIDNFLTSNTASQSDTFQKAIKLRFEKYREAYGEAGFPLELIDFFSRQYFVESTNGNPMMSVRITPILRCKEYALEWPLKELILKSGKDINIFALTDFLLNQGNNCPVYASGFAINNYLPRNIRKLSKELVSAVCYIELAKNGSSSIIAGGAIEHRMNKTLGEYGFEYFEFNGKKTPPILKPYFDSEIEIMKLDAPHEHGEAIYNKYLRHFDSSVLEYTGAVKKSA